MERTMGWSRGGIKEGKLRGRSINESGEKVGKSPEFGSSGIRIQLRT